ncbi:MAG TPA: hypothetical protein VLK82_25470 [Candidatus Tectomicrobia bacterium]|nr:hypothetical protein [Candidatus Tectomicrobia bacterium]
MRLGEGKTLQHSFQFAGDVGSATVRATVMVFDSFSSPFYEFDVDLTWIAHAEFMAHHSKETLHDKDLGIKIITHLHGRRAPAAASGTVLRLGINSTPAPDDSAKLQSENNGTLIIEKTVSVMPAPRRIFVERGGGAC